MAKLPKAVFADKINGVIKFGERKAVGYNQSSWYNHSWFEVPFVGNFDGARMATVLRKRVASQFNSLGEVKMVRPGVLQYEVIHSIGD